MAVHVPELSRVGMVPGAVRRVPEVRGPVRPSVPDLAASRGVPVPVGERVMSPRPPGPPTCSICTAPSLVSVRTRSRRVYQLCGECWGRADHSRAVVLWTYDHPARAP